MLSSSSFQVCVLWSPIEWATQDVAKNLGPSVWQFFTWPFSLGPCTWTGPLGTKGLMCLGAGRRRRRGRVRGLFWWQQLLQAGFGFLATAPRGPFCPEASSRVGVGGGLPPTCPAWGSLTRGTPRERGHLPRAVTEPPLSEASATGQPHPCPWQEAH